MTKPAISRKGVYYNLDLSPYKYVTPFGKEFRFSSKKKLEIYQREIDEQMRRLDKFIHRNNLKHCMDADIYVYLSKLCYEGLYEKVEA